MFGLSFGELFIIGVVGLIVIGPERLPTVARTLGHLVGRAQRYVSDVKSDIQREMDIQEIAKIREEMQSAVSDVKSSVEDTASALRNPVNALRDDLLKTGDSLRDSVTGRNDAADETAANQSAVKEPSDSEPPVNESPVKGSTVNESSVDEPQVADEIAMDKSHAQDVVSAPRSADKPATLAKTDTPQNNEIRSDNVTRTDSETLSNKPDTAAPDTPAVTRSDTHS